jgi:hypothetical protein
VTWRSRSGGAREAAARGAAGVVGHADERPVGEASAAGIAPAGEPLLHGCEPLDEQAQPPVVLRLLGQMRKPAGQHPLDEAEELAVGADAHRRLADGERDQLRIAHLGRAARPAGTGYSSAKT